MDFVETKFFSKNHVLDLNLKDKYTCIKKVHENRKNTKMNSSTQKYFTSKNVWKKIFQNMMEKMTDNAFYIESPNKKSIFNGDYLQNCNFKGC